MISGTNQITVYFSRLIAKGSYRIICLSTTASDYKVNIYMKATFNLGRFLERFVVGDFPSFSNRPVCYSQLPLVTVTTDSFLQSLPQLGVEST